MYTQFQKSFLLLLFIKHIRALSFKECKEAAEDTFVAIENNCLGYIYCRGDDSVTGLCPAGTYFDQLMQQCSVDTLLKCSNYAAAIAEEVVHQNNGESQQPLVRLSTPQYGAPSIHNIASTELYKELSVKPLKPLEPHRPHCNSANDEYFPYKFHCEYYYKCFRGYLSILRCGFGYGWDFLLQKCLPLNEAQCYKDSE
ncbi:uncharacterized protein [Eurosta solidaginis]|uniref:uncharacterized protein n=1 Tax=Eurosta solidaginis TaxID=178769 RepID=UPI003530EA91